jgi:transcriptional regulatory protein GAL4
LTESRRYFLFQASLIPVHCLRRIPTHSLALDWRGQVQTTLDVVDAMNDMNSSSSKCRDVILGLCGSSLHDHRSAEDYSNLFTGFESADDASTWAAAVDSTVGGYNEWCDWLSHTSTGTSAWAPTSVGDWDLGPIL